MTYACTTMALTHNYVLDLGPRLRLMRDVRNHHEGNGSNNHTIQVSDEQAHPRLRMNEIECLYGVGDGWELRSFIELVVKLKQGDYVFFSGVTDDHVWHDDKYIHSIKLQQKLIEYKLLA